MKKLIAIIIVFASINAVAQDKTSKSKIAFHSINQVGLMEGEGGGAFQIQSINGIKFKSFFTGIGVGIDEYHTRSIPLFLDLRAHLKQTGKSPFIYADAGTHFIWPKGQEKNEWMHYDDAGLFYDVGLGYRIPVKSNAVVLSAGYSFKSVSSKENRYYWWGEAEDFIYYDFKLRRISIKAGFSF